MSQLEIWHERSEREQASEKLLDLQVLTAAIAAAVCKEGGKFVKQLSEDLRAIATGKKTAPSDPKAAVRAHVRMLQQLGAKVRG